MCIPLLLFFLSKLSIYLFWPLLALVLATSADPTDLTQEADRRLMYLCMCIDKNTYIKCIYVKPVYRYVCMHTYIPTYLDTYRHTHMHLYVCIYSRTHTHTLTTCSK